MTATPFRLATLSGGLATLLLSGTALAAPDITFARIGKADAERVVVLADGAGALRGQFSEMDADTDGRLADALAASGFEGGFGEAVTLYGAAPYPTVVVVGTGGDELGATKLRDLGGHLAKHVGDGATVIADGLDTGAEHPLAEIALGMHLGAYRFDAYKSDAEDADVEVLLMGEEARADGRAFDGDYAHVAEAVSLVRDLGNEPGKSVYPEEFVRRVRVAFRGVSGVRIRVLDNDDMERLNMGAITGVGAGSVHDPRMMIVEYMGAGGDGDVVALVGKGITFDTGGISLKPNSGQWQMKSDLSGAAAVAGTLLAAAKRGADVNVVGIMPLAENMPDGRAIRPGDVLETYNGTTIEVMSTDAEGRLLLADAVAYAQDEYEPDLLVDIATLTGSAGRALGDDYAAVITRDFEMAQRMMEIGERAGEAVWPLPLHPSHYDQIESDIADIKSTAGSPGASIGAAVVGTFVDEDQPWVHLDIAGVDWRESATPTAPKGHAGWGVRFLDQLLRDMEEDG